MTFLPVVTRELRAAARRKTTFRIRSWTAALATVATCTGLILVSVVGNPSAKGGSLFALLTGYAFALCLLSGIFLTADCLSAEKREGTLGFLFLTSLRGYDVALGKFVGLAANAFYGLLALLPIAGVAFLMGGLTRGEFWRTALALLNGLFISLACGLFVSALARDSHRAMGGTLALLALMVGGLPALEGVLSAAGVPPAWARFAWASPAWSFWHAAALRHANNPAEFWASLSVSHFLGWALVGCASVVLSRSWQEKPPEFHHYPRDTLIQSPITLRPSPRRLFPAALRAKAPVLGLIENPSWVRTLAWLIAASWGLIALSVSLALPASGIFLVSYGLQIAAFFLKLLLAVQAGRFFAASRRDGTLELLLCTPLRNGDILKAQWLALRAVFLWPAMSLVGFGLIPVGAGLVATLKQAGTDEIVSSALQAGSTVLVWSWQVVVLAADALAIGWAGMWLALSLKKPGLAAGWTIVLTVILPGFLCMAGIFADLFLFLWGYTRMQQEFRHVIARQYDTPSVR